MAGSAAPALRGSFSLDDAFEGSSGAGGPVDDAMKTDTLDAAKSEFDDAAANIKKSREELKTKVDPLLGDIRANREEASSLALPKLQEIPEKTRDVERNPLEAFGSLASTMAIFGSLLTRAPLTNALNAAADVMDAWKGQDTAAAKKNFDVWKANISNADTLHKWQQDNYNNAIKKLDTDTDGALKEIQVLATVYKDDTMAELARTKQINELLRLENTRRSSMDDMMRAAQAAEKEQNFKMAVTEKETELGRPLNALERDELVDRYLGSGVSTPDVTEEAMDTAIEAKLKGDDTLLQGLGRSGANKVNTLNRLTAKLAERGLTPEQRGEMLANARAGFEGRKAAERATGTRTANLELAANELVPMMKIARTASASIPRSQFKPINQIVQNIQRGISDPNLKGLDFAVNTLVNVYTRAIRPTGVPTDADKEHTRELLLAADGPEAFEAALKMMELEIEAAKQSPAQTRKDIQRIYGGGAVPEAKPGEGAVDEDKPAAPVIKAEPTNQGAPPKGLAIPKDKAMMRLNTPYEINGKLWYWDGQKLVSKKPVP